MPNLSINEYRNDLLSETNIYQQQGYGFGMRDSFMRLMFSKLEESQQGDLISSFIPETKVGTRLVAADGYRFDDDDGTLILVLCDYNGLQNDLEPFTKAMAERAFKLLDGLVSATRQRECKELAELMRIHPGTDQWDLISLLEDKDPESGEHRVQRVRSFIFTDRISSDRFKKFDHPDIAGIPTELQIWDLKRFYELSQSLTGHEIHEYQFPENKIHLEKATEGRGFISYLGVIDGTTLADLYHDNGSRLLEGNVRSFLSSRGAVNKGIRRTLKEQPESFFVFNNGIAVTVRGLERDAEGYLRKATDFQIINGGQTTASISRAKYIDKVDISCVAVSMKLTEITSDLSEDEAADLIQDISRYSNNQNKVSDADFFSNHPFHREMENKSLRIATPAGLIRSTYWFYERSRGKYEQRTMFSTQRNKKIDAEKYPKNQVIKKEDLARLMMCWRDEPKPFIASKGATYLFKSFSEEVATKWENRDTTGEFSDDYYRNVVSLHILRMNLRSHIGGGKGIQAAPWYCHGYLANIVDYSLSILAWAANKEWGGVRFFNLKPIWNRQDVSESLVTVMMSIAEKVQSIITAPDRGEANVTQWCKKEACWTNMRKYFSSNNLLKNIESEFRISKETSLKIQKDRKKENKLDREIDWLNEAISYAYWQEAYEFEQKRKTIDAPSQRRALQKMLSITKSPRLPSSKDCQSAFQALELLRDQGFAH